MKEKQKWVKGRKRRRGLKEKEEDGELERIKENEKTDDFK